MRQILFSCLLLLLFGTISAQKPVSNPGKIESISFNLYTDSLKKGFYNYISIDGKLSDGSWLPLDSTQVILKANTGHFKGNDLFIDSTYTGDTVTVKAIMRTDPRVWKEVTIHIRKRGFDEPLKTNDEILDDLRKRKKNQLYNAR